MTPLWIIGSGGHATVVVDTARASGVFDVLGCLDDDVGRHGGQVLGAPVVGSISKATVEEHRIHNAVIAIGSNTVRRTIAARLGSLLEWAVVIHPDAYVAESATLGEGAVVFAGVVIQPQVRVGRHVICNTSSSVDHDSRIGDWVHIGPGARLAGDTAIGDGALLGIGSSVAPGVGVGEWSVVGAGATVIHDLPSNVTAIGTPSRSITTRPNGLGRG